MDCPICFDNICDETGSVVMSCKHMFHLGCITEWLGRNPTCPCCRKKPSDKETVARVVPQRIRVGGLIPVPERVSVQVPIPVPDVVDHLNLPLD